MTLASVVTKLVVVIILWISFSMIGSAVAVRIFDTDELRMYVERGIPLYAKVLTKDSSNHQLITYEYFVENRRYTGKGHGRAGNPSFEDIVEGQQVVIFYDPSDPQRSIMGYPHGDLESNESLVWLVSLIFPLFPLSALLIGYVFYRAIRKSTVAEM